MTGGVNLRRRSQPNCAGLAWKFEKIRSFGDQPYLRTGPGVNYSPEDPAGFVPAFDI